MLPLPLEFPGQKVTRLNVLAKRSMCSMKADCEKAGGMCRTTTLVRLEGSLMAPRAAAAVVVGWPSETLDRNLGPLLASTGADDDDDDEDDDGGAGGGGVRVRNPSFC